MQHGNPPPFPTSPSENMPADPCSLSARLDFTQTCLATRTTCLTGGLTEPIFRTATVRSEPAAQPAAGGKTWKNRRESTDARLKSVWHGRLTDDFKGPVMNMTGSYGNSLWIQLPFLSRLYGPFRSVFLFIYFFFLQHQECDLAVHLHADTVTLAGLLLMLIYMACAFLWVPDDIPHGSHWY